MPTKIIQSPENVPLTEAAVWSRNVRLRNRSAQSQDDLRRIQRTAFEFSSSPEAYDVLISDGKLLETPCQRGLLNVFPDGKFWHISGGLIAPDDLKPEMIRWLKQIAEHRRIGIAVYTRQ